MMTARCDQDEYIVNQPERVFATDNVAKLRRFTDYCVTHRRWAIAYGPSGAGKTTASVDAAFLAGRRHGVLVAAFSCKTNADDEFIRARMVDCLAGRPPAALGLAGDNDLIRLIRSVPCLFVFDEAQNMGASGVGYTQHLFERCTFPALFVGDFQLEKMRRKASQFASRVDRRAEFEWLKDDELRATLGVMHPAFAEMTPRAFQRLQGKFKNNLHHWKNVAKAIDSLSVELGLPPVLDMTMTDAVITELT